MAFASSSLTATSSVMTFASRFSTKISALTSLLRRSNISISLIHVGFFLSFFLSFFGLFYWKEKCITFSIDEINLLLMFRTNDRFKKIKKQQHNIIQSVLN